MSSFKYEEEIAGDTIVVSISGAIKEHAKFAREDYSKFNHIIIDLMNVIEINSLGIAIWLKWVKNLQNHPSVRFRNCPHAIVLQFNTVKGFLPKFAMVDSFMIPFYCDKCGKAETQIIQTLQDLHLGHGTPALKTGVQNKVRCEDSSCLMAVDMNPVRYLGFLRRS